MATHAASARKSGGCIDALMPLASECRPAIQLEKSTRQADNRISTQPTFMGGESSLRISRAHDPQFAIALLMAMVFILSLGYSAWMPLLPLYLHGYIAKSSPSTMAWHVGMLGGVYTFALFAFSSWWGRRSDRWGRIRVLQLGFAGYLLGILLSALATNLMTVYAARILSGIGAAAVMPAAQAYIADVSDITRRNRRFVFLGSASFIGFLAGPMLGSWLAGPVMGMTAGSMLWMVNLPLLVIPVLGLPVLLAAHLWVKPSPTPHPAEVLAATESADRARFARASMLLAAVAAFAVGTFEIGFNLFGGLTLKAGTTAVAILFVTCSVSMLAAQTTLVWESVRRHVDHHWLAAAFAMSALAMAITPWTPDVVSLGLLVTLVAASIGLIGPVISYELLDHGGALRGAMLGNLAAASNLGQALGSFAAGWLFSFRPGSPFWFAALALMGGSLAAYFYWGEARRNVMIAGIRTSVDLR